MTSAFDPKSFLDATISTPLERRDPLPVENPETSDKLYFGVIGEINSRAWQGKKDPTQSGIAWDVPIEIQIPGSLQAAGMPPTLTIKDSIMIDLTAGGTIDSGKGKNNRLRMYREAVDLNKPGDSFSARALQGKPVKVKINHDSWEGTIQERVAGVLKA